MATCTTSGGYDYKFVDRSSKSLECLICLSVVRDPHVTSCCGNHFCQLCINPIQRGNRPCPLCNEPSFTTFLHKGLAREVKALKMYCPNEPLGCYWVGELGQVEKHLNPEDESKRERVCGFVMVDCKYGCGSRFQRQLVRKHETENCHKSPFKQESDMALLFKKLAALASENKVIKTELQELKKAKNTALGLKAEVVALKVENATLKQQIELRPLPPVPPFYFTLNNYEHYEETDYDFSSPPFYSHYGGYKLNFTVRPGGCEIGYNSYMSLYMHIMAGEYDGQLRWPVRMRVTMEMYHWTLQQWKEVTSINTQMLSRPIEYIANYACNIAKFMPYYRLEQCYLLNDVVHFRVTRVQLLY